MFEQNISKERSLSKNVVLSGCHALAGCVVTHTEM